MEIVFNRGKKEYKKKENFAQNHRCIIPQFSKNINNKRKSRYITVIDIIIKHIYLIRNCSLF